MPIYQTASYRIASEGVEAVKAAIVEFVDHVSADEPGTLLYRSWQQEDDPTRFVHLFIFSDEAAHRAHGESDAVRRFEAVYRPFLNDGPVEFRNYGEVATRR